MLQISMQGYTSRASAWRDNPAPWIKCIHNAVFRVLGWCRLHCVQLLHLQASDHTCYQKLIPMNVVKQKPSFFSGVHRRVLYIWWVHRSLNRYLCPTSKPLPQTLRSCRGSGNPCANLIIDTVYFFFISMSPMRALTPLRHYVFRISQWRARSLATQWFALSFHKHESSEFGRLGALLTRAWMFSMGLRGFPVSSPSTKTFRLGQLNTENCPCEHGRC